MAAGGAASVPVCQILHGIALFDIAWQGIARDGIAWHGIEHRGRSIAWHGIEYRGISIALHGRAAGGAASIPVCRLPDSTDRSPPRNNCSLPVQCSSLH